MPKKYFSHFYLFLKVGNDVTNICFDAIVCMNNKHILR